LITVCADVGGNTGLNTTNKITAPMSANEVIYKGVWQRNVTISIAWLLDHVYCTASKKEHNFVGNSLFLYSGKTVIYLRQILCFVYRASLYNLFQIKPTRRTLLLSIFISTSLHVSGNYVSIIRRTYCIYTTLVFFTLYGWLSGLQ